MVLCTLKALLICKFTNLHVAFKLDLKYLSFILGTFFTIGHWLYKPPPAEEENKTTTTQMTKSTETLAENGKAVVDKDGKKDHKFTREIEADEEVDDNEEVTRVGTQERVGKNQVNDDRNQVKDGGNQVTNGSHRPSLEMGGNEKKMTSFPKMSSV